MERALRAEKLIPGFLVSGTPAAMALKWWRYDIDFVFFLTELRRRRVELRRRRVEDIDHVHVAVGLNIYI